MNIAVLSLLVLMTIVMSLFEHRISNKNRWRLFFIVGLFFCFVFANRDIYLSRDTAEYYYIWNKADISDGFFTRIERFEGGYCFLNRIIQLLFGSFRMFLFFVSFIELEVAYFILRKASVTYSLNQIFPLSFLCLLMPYFGILYSAIAMRAGLAIAFVYLSVIFIKGKHYAKAIVSFLISFSFHQSSVFAIPLLAMEFVSFKIPHRLCLTIVILTLIAYISGIGTSTSHYVAAAIGVLSTKFPDILFFNWAENGASDLSSMGISFSRLFYFIALLYCIIQSSERYVSSYVLYAAIGLMIQTFFGGVPLTIRVSEFYLISIIAVLYRVRVSISNNRLINQILVVSVPSLLFYIVLINNSI